MSLKALEAEGILIDWKAWRMPLDAAPPAKPEGYFSQAKEALQQLMDEKGLTIQSPSRKQDTLLAHMGAKVAKDHQVFGVYHRLVFEAIWVHDQNVEDPSVLADIAKVAGMNPDELLKALQDPEYKEMVEADFALGEEQKIWTIPSYVGDYGIIQVHHFKDIPSLEELRRIL